MHDLEHLYQSQHSDSPLIGFLGSVFFYSSNALELIIGHQKRHQTTVNPSITSHSLNGIDIAKLNGELNGE